MTTLVREAGNIIQDVCHKASFDAGWWAPKFVAGYTDNGPLYLQEARAGTRFGKALVAEKLALVHSEISEALEGHRKNKMDDHLPHRKSIEVELADAIIRIGDLAGALQLDLGGAIEEKMAYNKVREDHKPEARNAEGGKAY